MSKASWSTSRASTESSFQFNYCSAQSPSRLTALGCALFRGSQFNRPNHDGKARPAFLDESDDQTQREVAKPIPATLQQSSSLRQNLLCSGRMCLPARLACSLSRQYADLLTGSYDCLNRLVFSGWDMTPVAFVCGVGGLIRICITRLFRGYAQANGISVVNRPAWGSKHDNVMRLRIVSPVSNTRIT
jgi:hypothetical protein